MEVIGGGLREKENCIIFPTPRTGEILIILDTLNEGGEVYLEFLGKLRIYYSARRFAPLEERGDTLIEEIIESMEK